MHKKISELTLAQGKISLYASRDPEGELLSGEISIVSGPGKFTFPVQCRDFVKLGEFFTESIKLLREIK